MADDFITALTNALGPFAGSTAGVQSGLQQQGLSNQMQQFLMALLFQQQQAAGQQASNYSTAYGYAPGGNWMTWGPGGPTQPSAGTPTLTAQQVQSLLGQQSLANALNMSSVTGQFAQPLPSNYTAGTILTAPSTTPGLGPAYGIVNQDGSVQMLSSQALQQTAAQRGTTAQAMMQGAQPVDWNTLQTLSQGPPTGPRQQTLAAQNQQYAQALQSGQLTGTFYDPSQTADALLQQGKSMDGKSFNDLPPEEQQYWLSYNQNNPTAASQQWARAANGALQQAGYKNPQAGGQQTLQAINQAAQLSGMYNGAPTETAREFNASNALAQGALGQQYLATAAQLQGPQNTFQLSNYMRGAAANPNVPVYLQNLANNTGTAAFQAEGSQTPTPASMTGLAGGMGYGSQASTGGATSGWNYGDTLDAIKGIAQRGGQALAPGSLERLTPDELQAFGSGLGAAGYTLPSFLAQYNSSRVGQQAPTARATLA